MYNNSYKPSFGDNMWQGMWLIFPLNPWFNEKTHQVYTKDVFTAMRCSNTTWLDFHNKLESYISFRREVFGTTTANHEYYLMMDNKRFAFSFYIKGHHLVEDSAFHLWDDFSQSLGTYKIAVNEVPTEEFITWVKEKCRNSIDGIYECSDCGSKMDKIAGRYFAGVYCQHCWDTKWKAIEAKETYN